VLAALCLVLAAVSLALMTPAVQTWLAEKASASLSKKLGTEIRIDGVELRLWGPNRLHGVFIADLKGDTLLASDEIWVRGLRVHRFGRLIEAKRVELHRTRLAMEKAVGDGHSNLTNLLEKLGSSSSADSTNATPWRFQCRQVDIRDFHFSFHDRNRKPLAFGVDVDHVDIPSAQILGHNLAVAGDSICFHFDAFSFKDRSGLAVQQLTGAARVASRGVQINGLHLVTGPQRKGSKGSEVRGDLDLQTSDLADFDEFTTRVNIKADLDSSRLQLADVALFAPDLEGIDYAVALGGSFRGTVNEFKGKGIDLDFGSRSHFRGDVEMSGLPDIRNTFIVLDARDIHTGATDLAEIPVPPFKEGHKLVIPPEVVRLGRMEFKGNFTGFINSFTTYGSATSAAGTLRSDISFERDTVSKFFRLHGKLATDGFDLGMVLVSDEVRRLAVDVDVTASGKDINSLVAEIDGSVPELGLAKYTIGGIVLNGRLEKNLFNGALHCNDPKLQLDFNGLADLRGKWPDVDFKADVRRMDLRALGIIGGEGYSDLVMQVNAKGRLAPDSLQGSVRLRDVEFCQDTVELHLGDIALDAWNEGRQPVVKLQSDMANAVVRGPFYPTLLPGAVTSAIFSIFPSLEDQVKYAQAVQDFTFEVGVGNAQPLLDVVLPGLALDQGATFTGSFSSKTFDLDLDARIPHAGYKNLSGDSLVIALSKTMDLLAFSLKGNGRMAKDSVALHNLYITGQAYQDEVRLRADWSGQAGKAGQASGTINLNALVNGPSSMSVQLEPSQVDLGQGIWHNDQVANILVDSMAITVDSLALVNGAQSLRLSGAVSRDSTRALAFNLEHVRTENLKPLYNGPEVHGSISGDGRLFDLYGNPFLLSFLCVDSLAIQDKPVGDLQFAASYNEQGDAINVNGALERDTLRAFSFSGTLNPGKAQELDLKLHMDHFDLRFINPYLPDAISDIQGQVTGVVNVTGKLAEPQINGTANMVDAGLRINYLNTFYKFTHTVDIQPDMFALDQVKLRDDEGHIATANGTIIHHGLKDWNFDVSLDMDNFKVLDTDESNNELYYGKAYATGSLGVSGYADNLEVDVDAATASGTDIHFPLGASTNVGSIPFVRFTGNGLAADSVEQAVDLSGIRLDMKVAVTPDAKFELIFDPTVGDIMRGRGQGNLAMTVTPSGDFSMKGDVDLVDGDYLFTLRNLVNKRFSVEPGGRISWYGDPFDAIINVDAVYRLRASLYDVIPVALRTEAYKKRFPVEVVMHLSQKLMNPDIAFDVKLPTVDEAVRTQVNSALATTDDMNKQVFSLIVLNRFLPSDATASQSDNNGLGSATATTGTELLSNQLSNWLSSLSNNIDFGVNWRTGDVISQDEVEVALSTQIFNDRLQLSTNVGVAYGNGGTQQGSNIIGDFSAEYSLTQDGKLRFKAFSQSNDKNLGQVDQAQTTQGAGLAYREEFNTLGEFFRNFWAGVTGRKNRLK
jgi:hypothetical protein